MPTKIQITRGLQFHSQEQCYEVDIPDGNKTTIADLRGILITQKVMTENDLFILPNSNLNLESSLDSPSSSSDTSVQPAVLVKLDENRNDWSRLQKVDEVSCFIYIYYHRYTDEFTLSDQLHSPSRYWKLRVIFKLRPNP